MITLSLIILSSSPLEFMHFKLFILFTTHNNQNTYDFLKAKRGRESERGLGLKS